MIIVKDVAASSRWYQEVLGLESAHGGSEFEMLMGGDGQLALMLHHLDFSEHAAVEDPREGTPGRGILLYFSVEDVQSVYARAVDGGTEVIDEPHLNPNARAVEFSLRDPDGYALSISQWQG